MPNKNAAELPVFNAIIEAASEIFQELYEKIISYSRNQYPQSASELVNEWANILNVNFLSGDNLQKGIRLQSRPAGIFNAQAIREIGEVFEKELSVMNVTGSSLGFVVGINKAGDSVGATQSQIVTAISISGTEGDTELQKALYFYAPAWVTLEFT